MVWWVHTTWYTGVASSVIIYALGVYAWLPQGPSGESYAMRILQSVAFSISFEQAEAAAYLLLVVMSLALVCNGVYWGMHTLSTHIVVTASLLIQLLGSVDDDLISLLVGSLATILVVTGVHHSLSPKAAAPTFLGPATDHLTEVINSLLTTISALPLVVVGFMPFVMRVSTLYRHNYLSSVFVLVTAVELTVAYRLWDRGVMDYFRVPPDKVPIDKSARVWYGIWIAVFGLASYYFNGRPSTRAFDALVLAAAAAAALTVVDDVFVTHTRSHGMLLLQRVLYIGTTFSHAVILVCMTSIVYAGVLSEDGTLRPLLLVVLVLFFGVAASLAYISFP